METQKPILFFDGVCNLCNAFVDFLIRRDKKQKLMFASLQGKTAAKLLSQEQLQHMDSLVVYDDGKVYKKADAIRRLIIHLGGLWKIFLVFYIFPNFILNFFYDRIAKIRYKILGKKETCRVPTAEERARFLD